MILTCGDAVVGSLTWRGIEAKGRRAIDGPTRGPAIGCRKRADFSEGGPATIKRVERALGSPVLGPSTARLVPSRAGVRSDLVGRLGMVQRIDEHEVVRLRRDVEGFPAGTTATVVHLNTDTDLVLEIVGGEGETLGIIDVGIGDIEKLDDA